MNVESMRKSVGMFFIFAFVNAWSQTSPAYTYPNDHSVRKNLERKDVPVVVFRWK